MGRLPLTLACWSYDRTRGLADGSIPVDGVDLNYLSLPVEETFFRMLRYAEFDAAEMSLSSYCVSLLREDPKFIAIPAFPSRFFRHSCIFVSTRSGIDEPSDLIGRRVGVPEYQMTAPVWIRGILADDYGVDPSAVEHLTGGEEEPGREEKLRLTLPERFRVRPIGADETLSAMLADGSIDALYTARTPSTFERRPADVRRLFSDYRAVEEAYFERTRIFPIMHVVVLRRDVYRANPWVAQSLLKAFRLSLRRSYLDLQETAASMVTAPWMSDHLDGVRRILGDDYWSYGFAENRHVLETFLRYHHEQGLSARLLIPEELFAPETLETFKI